MSIPASSDDTHTLGQAGLGRVRGHGPSRWWVVPLTNSCHSSAAVMATVGVSASRGNWTGSTAGPEVGSSFPPRSYTEISAGRRDRKTVHDRKIVLKAHAQFAISCEDVRPTTNAGTDDVVSSSSSSIMQVDHDGGDLIDLLTRRLIISWNTSRHASPLKVHVIRITTPTRFVMGYGIFPWTSHRHFYSAHHYLGLHVKNLANAIITPILTLIPTLTVNTNS